MNFRLPCCRNCKYRFTCEEPPKHGEWFIDEFICDFFVYKRLSGAERRKRAKQNEQNK